MWFKSTKRLPRKSEKKKFKNEKKKREGFWKVRVGDGEVAKS